MIWSARRLIWPAVGAIALVGTALVRGSIDGRTRVPLEASATVAVIGVAAIVAFAHGWITGDRSMVFVATGAAGVAANLILFDLIWQEGKGGLRTTVHLSTMDLSVPAFVNLAAWLLFGMALVFAVPWWERRGRRSSKAAAIVLAGLGGLAVLDLIAFWTRTGTAIGSVPTPRGEIPITLTRPAAVVLAWGVIAVLAVAAGRCMLDVRRGATSGWLCAAAVAGIGAPAVWLLGRGAGWETFRVATAWYLIVPSVVGSFILLATFASIRTSMSSMRRSTDRAQDIVDGRAEIASMIAHEVRGPVTTIRGIASTASTHYDRLSDAERLEFFSLIEQESRRLLGAVDQTSLALKIDAGSLTFQKAPAPLATVVRAGVDAADVAPDDHRIHVVAHEDVFPVIDASRITEVVRQLVSNAATFSPAGTPITVRAVADEGEAVIEVTDQGPGIPLLQREVVFERFTRWRPSGYEERPGNGLGLFISRGLVTEHQGEISIEDGPGGGTMLRVRLPLEGA